MYLYVELANRILRIRSKQLVAIFRHAYLLAPNGDNGGISHSAMVGTGTACIEVEL